MQGVNRSSIAPTPDHIVLGAVCAFAAAFVVFGFLVDGPVRVFHGLVLIVTTRDALLTDYFGIGGIGAACVNAGLLTLCACLVYRLANAKITGASVACLFLVLGFGALRQEPFQHLVDRRRRLSLRAVQGRAVFGPCQHGVLRRRAGACLLGDPVQHVPDPRNEGAACDRDKPRHRLYPGARPPRSSSRPTWDSACTTWGSPRAGGHAGRRPYKSYGFVPDPVLSGPPATTSCSAAFLSLVFVSMIAVGFYFDRALPSG